MWNWTRQTCAILFLLGATVARPTLALAEDTEGDDGDSLDDNPRSEAGAVRKDPRSFYDLARERPIAIEAQFAPLGSPIGQAGIAADISVLPPLALYGGIGAGGQGLQWVLGMRPRLALSDSSAITATLAYSQGKFRELNLGLGETGDGDSGSWNWGNTSWANADVGYEYRSESGFLVHVFTGISQALHTDTPVWSTASGITNPPWSLEYARPSSPKSLIYFAVAIGFHFGGT